MDATLLVVILGVVAVGAIIVIKMKPPEPPKSNLTDAAISIGKIIAAF